MKTTANGLLLDITPEQKAFLDDLMHRYCAAVRFSYKRLLDGIAVQNIRLRVYSQFNLNSRQANDAVYEAQSLIAEQRELLNMYIENTQLKIESLQKKLKKAKSPFKIAGLQSKLNKRQRILNKWLKHKEKETLPKVIFGSRELFMKRCKNQISHEEWFKARNSRYLSRGDKAKGGNLNTRLYVKDQKLWLDIASEPIKTTKSTRYQRISVLVYLAQKRSKKTGKVNGINYQQTVIDYLATKNAYQVELIRKNEKYYVHVTFEEAEAQPYQSYGVHGIDTNPTGLGIADIDDLGQYRGSQFLVQGEWVTACSNRRMNLIGETAKQIVQSAKAQNKGLVVENLKFAHDKDVKAKFNRISHSFVWRTFLSMLERTAQREGVPLIKVKPAFTSVIGILKYQQQYGLSNHEAAAYVIGRRGLGFSREKIPKKLKLKLIKPKKLKDFDTHNNFKQWSLIKKEVNKNLKKKGGLLVSYQHYRKALA